MPDEFEYDQINSEEVQEIITSVPSWIIRCGITLIFFIIILLVLFSALVEYPEVIRANMIVNSSDAPKTVLAHKSGKITTVLIKEGATVAKNQPLAYLESSADPEDVVRFARLLKTFQKDMDSRAFLQDLTGNINLGEIQVSYTNFYQQLLEYQSTQEEGYYINKRHYLKNDLKDITNLKTNILKQKEIQALEYANIEQEYLAYKKLFSSGVISRSEFAVQENKYLASKYPIQQTENSILNNSSIYSTKEKELLELDHIVNEQRARFIQSLNQCLSEVDAWILEHVMKAPMAGKVAFAGIIQQNQNVIAGQEVFIVNPGNTDFFGEVLIPQYSMGKIDVGKVAMVKLKSYPFEQFGMIRGKLTYVSDVAHLDSVFIAKIRFEHIENKDSNRKIVLKNGMQGDAEIITEESTLLERFYRNIIKGINSH
jgi:multidrug efflux pump subunit AcrA (membrane-fusion protein)